jgi:hypothetical protein
MPAHPSYAIAGHPGRCGCELRWIPAFGWNDGDGRRRGLRLSGTIRTRSNRMADDVGPDGTASYLGITGTTRPPSACLQDANRNSKDNPEGMQLLRTIRTAVAGQCGQPGTMR